MLKDSSQFEEFIVNYERIAIIVPLIYLKFLSKLPMLPLQNYNNERLLLKRIYHGSQFSWRRFGNFNSGRN